MKSILSLLFLAFTFQLTAQINFNTGSTELDADLNSINVSAKSDLGLFKKELSADFNVSIKEIDYMFSLNLEPGDVYMSLELGKISNTKPTDVADKYVANKSKGWGAMAKELGIKPGSAEFHELKQSTKNKKSKNKGSGKSNGKGNGNGKSKK